MAFNHDYWRGIFERDFLPQLRSIVDALDSRMLPGFEGIEQEAEQHSDEMYRQLGEMPGTGDEDLSVLAEAAMDAGVNHYMLLRGIRQGIVNLFAASLFHAFEQQIMLFHRKEILQPAEANDSKLFKLAVFRSRLLVHGIDIYAFQTWPVIDELRLVANTVKHAEGDSAQRLHELRPDFFKEHGLPGLGEWVTRWQPRVFQPLVGKDLFLELKDVRAYLNTLVGFWEELSTAIAKV